MKDYKKISLFIISIILIICASLGKDFSPSTDIDFFIPRMTIYYNGSYAIPRVLAWGIPSLILVTSFMLINNRLNFGLANLGKYTYSVYILQYFFIPLIGKFKLKNMPEGLALLLPLILLSISAYLCYWYFEMPFLKLAKNKTRPSQVGIKDEDNIN
jgi:peptidoglycan/LPS O-acetylase OafA/YrhL